MVKRIARSMWLIVFLLAPVRPAASQPRTLEHYERIAKSPGIEGIWRGHLSLFDKEHNTAENMIANVEETADCKAIGSKRR